MEGLRAGAYRWASTSSAHTIAAADLSGQRDKGAKEGEPAMMASKLIGWALVVDIAILIALSIDVYFSYQNMLMMRQMSGVRYGR